MVADKSVVNKNRFEKAGTKADVIFAFFGYNESWAGEAGVAKFKDDYDKWVKHALSQKYNVTAYPTLVVVDAAGNEMAREVGYRPADRFTTFLSDVRTGRGTNGTGFA